MSKFRDQGLGLGAPLHHNDNLPAGAPPALVAAIERLSRWASSGASGEELVSAAVEFVTSLQEAGASADAVREAITAVVADVAEGKAAAEQFADEAETDQQRISARGQVKALRALQEALAAIAERLG